MLMVHNKRQQRVQVPGEHVKEEHERSGRVQGKSGKQPDHRRHDSTLQGRENDRDKGKKRKQGHTSSK